MPDYAALLDEEVKAFLSKVAAFYPDDAVNLSIADQRRLYDAMSAAFDAGRPAGLVVEDCAFAGVSCRVYGPAAPRGTLLYCHGGGFVVGGLDSHDSICAELSIAAHLRVVAVDYRLSPEHPHPADFEDALRVFDVLAGSADGPLVLAGDSAGGNLVAAVAHARRGTGRLKGQLLIYPGLGGGPDLPSYKTHAHAPGLSTRDMAYYMAMRAGGEDKANDPTFAPLKDRDFSGLPPTVVITAECDPLSSDGDAYVSALRAAQVPALWVEEKGLVHAYLRARHMSAKAACQLWPHGRKPARSRAWPIARPDRVTALSFPRFPFCAWQGRLQASPDAFPARRTREGRYNRRRAARGHPSLTHSAARALYTSQQ